MDTIKKERFLELLNYLNHGLVEREGTLKVALLTMLAGENLLLVGPPGTAKSLIARKLAKCLVPSDDKGRPSHYFEYLLTKYSTPEEIFGPLSISALKMDQFKRNTEGYLPSVRLAFLDEVFKASSSILNTLLTILNERLFHNGAVAVEIPLQSLIAASNELPTGQEELDALYDRFLVRSFVGYVSEDNLPRLLDKRGPELSIRALSERELITIREQAANVSVPENIISALRKIWADHRQEFKEDRREQLSDRRLTKVVNLLRVAAACNERTVVDLSDLLLLKDCLWNHRDNAVKVHNLVMKVLMDFNEVMPQLEGDAEPLTLHQVVMHSPSAKFGTVIKGFKGSGTEHDPILIESLHDLAGLERPEVGLKHYWFRQTTDIDCRELTTWLKIDFQGTYDGGGYAIEYERSGWISLFDNVQQGAVIRNLHLVGLGLAVKIIGSEVSNCASDVKMISHSTESKIIACESTAALMDGATKSSISYCSSGSALVNGNVSQVEVSNCRSQHVLINGECSESTIANCEILVNGKWENSRSGEGTGGVARRLIRSNVQACIVSGRPTTRESVKFSAISDVCCDSVIRQCAMGKFCFDSGIWRSRGRLFDWDDNISKFENNVALDCHPGVSDANGKDGRTVAAKLMTPHYFEHTLDWDFTKIWEWSDVESKPKLRNVGLGSTNSHVSSGKNTIAMGDLLGQQFSANVWL